MPKPKKTAVEQVRVDAVASAQSPAAEKAPKKTKASSAAMHKHTINKPMKAAAISQSHYATPPNTPSREHIAKLAYSYWEARGYQGGSSEEDWLRAEAELLKAANL